MYTWANSISKGVSRERGGGFTVTEMTLEFRTVVFLGQSQQVESGGRGAYQPCGPSPGPPSSLPHMAAAATSAGPGPASPMCPTPPPAPSTHLCRARKLPRFR